MKIAALIQLILEMNTSADFLNLIKNVEEYNFDWICINFLYCNLEEIGSIRQHSGTQIRSWPIIVAELAARRTCRGKFATRGTQVFKAVLKKI